MSRVKTNAIAEFGDFQTPRALADRVCALLGEIGVAPASIVEPTCGRGAFVFASANRWPLAQSVLGFELNSTHLAIASENLAVRADHSRIILEQSDFFDTNWKALLDKLPEPVLVIGNPPWVTNAHISSLGGSNVPKKSNFKGHKGFDAITGKANFDISEWMLLKLTDALDRRNAVLAMLVKTVVARKLLYHSWKAGHSLVDANMFRIDAGAHFDAAVDASLIVMKFGQSPMSMRAHVFGQLSQSIPPIATIALVDDSIVADLDAYKETKQLCGSCGLKWRSGIKHDCSKVMELRRDGERFRNGLGETVELEHDYLFPMLKTSEVAGGNTGNCSRWMIVPQRRIGDCTSGIAECAPRTWEYLQEHRQRLGKRGSSIYRDKPDFSIFGIGDYTFAPWKIAISGMYKTLRFVKVGSCDGKPVVLDDTSNFLPCPTEASASLLLSMLESKVAQTFYRAFVFWDAKRPVTIELLGRLDLYALASELGIRSKFEEHFGPACDARRKRNYDSQTLPEALSLWSV